MKKFKNKKEMFARTAANLHQTMEVTSTGEQCCSRYKTIVRRKTSATAQNKKSENSPCEVPYEEELAKISALDDSIEPEQLRDGYGIVSRNGIITVVSSRKGSWSGEAKERQEGSQFDDDGKAHRATEYIDSTHDCR